MNVPSVLSAIERAGFDPSLRVAIATENRAVLVFDGDDADTLWLTVDGREDIGHTIETDDPGWRHTLAMLVTAMVDTERRIADRRDRQ